FFRQMAIMVASGIPFITALTLASEQVESPLLQGILHTMGRDINNGVPFSEAASRFPVVFDEVTVSLLKSGEATGQMQQVLGDLADHTEKSAQFGTRVRAAFLYPTFVVAIMVVVGIIMTVVVVPRLKDSFADTSFTLPVTTQVLVSLSNALIHYWYLIAAGLLMIFLLLRSYFVSVGGHRVLFSIQTTTPFLRQVTFHSYLVRFASLLAMLIRAAVPLPEALRIVGDSFENHIWAKTINSVRQEVERGVPLSAALSRHPIFPEPLVQMIGVGEQTGQMEATLTNMANFYEDQTNASIKALATLIEPVALVVVSLAVGFVVLAVILPIYSITQQL
ncbi:MAG TPA: type II secretion system F family protein, partial [Patescibacteria group bacterium]